MKIVHLFKDALNAFDDFKSKQKSLKQCFLICKSIYIYSESVINTLYIEIKYKINVAQNALFFLSQAPTHDSFTFNL